MEVERIDYDEAKKWFGYRTWMWAFPGFVASALMWFVFSRTLSKSYATRLWLAVILGLAVELLGLLAAQISIQFPWMRFGWRLSFLLNGPVCAALSAVGAFLGSGVVLAYLQNDVTHLPSAGLIHAVYVAMQFAIVVSALWGFVFGSWFALRRDKYFVEPM